MYNNIKELIDEARNSSSLKLAVAAAGDEVVLESVKKAHELGIIEPVLIGNKAKILKILNTLNYNFKGKILGTDSRKESANMAMKLIADGEADYPMKGLISTKKILKAMLKKEYELRQESLLSVVTLLNLERENRIVILTDCGMNIDPDLEEKVQIINNSVEMARAIGIYRPRVAALAAIEKVNPDMPDTVDAALLAKMSERGQIEGVMVDGPLAFDNAISVEAAEHKGIDSSVAGKADILLAPDIEAGNLLYKSLVYYSEIESASLVLGAKVPLVLTSRADNSETKFNSIALGKLVTLELKNIFWEEGGYKHERLAK